MMTTVALFNVSTLSSEFTSTIKLGRLQKDVGTQLVKRKENVQMLSKVLSANILKTGNHEVAPSTSSSRTSFNPLQDLSLRFNAFTKETSQRKEEQKKIDLFGSDELAPDKLSYCENLRIRSYEIGANGTVSMETLMNHLQEVGLNHLKCAGLLEDGLGSSPEMHKRNLIWVTTKVQIVIDRYPTWGDSVQIETSIAASGKSSMRRDSIVRDCNTGKTLVRVSSNWVLMNKVTRKLCRIPDEVRFELGPYMKDAQAPPLVENDKKKTPKLDESTADNVSAGLRPRWGDLDINQHVNNGKFVAWILESVPPSIRENGELTHITMEYRRECHWDDVLQSLTAVSDCTDSEIFAECGHLLRLEDGSEVMKARTEWRLKDI